MRAQRLFIVVFDCFVNRFDALEGPDTPLLKSAKGLFSKYRERPGTDYVEVCFLDDKGKKSTLESLVWKRAVSETKTNGAERDGVEPEPNAQVETGVYIVAHGIATLGKTAGRGPMGLAGLLYNAKIPKAQKISFDTCSSSGLIDEEILAGKKYRTDAKYPDGTELKHEDKNFVVLFGAAYKKKYGENGDLYVAGWDDFVSVYHGEKDKRTVPENAVAELHVGKKFVNIGTRKEPNYKFSNPIQLLGVEAQAGTPDYRSTMKKMYKWSYANGKPVVERIAYSVWHKV